MKRGFLLFAAAFFLISASASAEEPLTVSSATAHPGSLDLPRNSAQTGYTLQPPDGQKRWGRAIGELTTIGIFAPWFYNRYIADQDFAKISFDSINSNIKNGFWWDRDGFDVNMRGHPLQGSVYYNAARINGFNFWEAAPFVMAGDLTWEYVMETEQPAYNDLVNTFLGGMSRGEVSYRLSRAIIDNEATGWEKVGRELGAGILNPVGFLDRAVFGDMWQKAPNPTDRLPQRMFLMVDGGYIHGRDSSPHPDAAFASLELRENDMHDIRIKAPFDYFDISAAGATEGPGLPAMQLRGLLAGWELNDQADNHQLLAPTLSYNFFNSETSSFGGQGLGLYLFSRWNLPDHFEIRTEAGGTAFFAAGIQTDYTQNSLGATGRNYDFGTGGGPGLDFKIRRNDVDWLSCSLYAGWFDTNNGISSENRIFTVNTTARYPITDDLFGGVGWMLQDRYTLYDDLPATSRTNSEIKVFLSYAFRLVG